MVFQSSLLVVLEPSPLMKGEIHTCTIMSQRPTVQEVKIMFFLRYFGLCSDMALVEKIFNKKFCFFFPVYVYCTVQLQMALVPGFV